MGVISLRALRPYRLTLTFSQSPLTHLQTFSFVILRCSRTPGISLACNSPIWGRNQELCYFFFLFAFALKYCFIFLYSFIQFSLIKMGGKKQSFFLVPVDTEPRNLCCLFTWDFYHSLFPSLSVYSSLLGLKWNPMEQNIGFRIV